MKTDLVEAYIEATQVELRPLVIKLRNAVQSVSNDLKESIKWRVPTYSIKAHICSIIVHKKHVNLQVFKGSQITGCDALLGSGKDMRHIKFQDINEVNPEVITAVLQQAIKLDGV